MLKTIPHNLKVADTKHVDQYKFANGHEAPIFEVDSMHGLNQIIGHAKFTNRNFGQVFYRGQCKLYDKLLPSLFRGCKKTSSVTGELKKTINRIISDKQLSNDLKVSASEKELSEIKIEGILQHYGLPTRYLDLVDNHWVALWMGNNRYEEKKIKNKYCHFIHREILFEDKECGIYTSSTNLDELYQYIILLAVPYSTSNSEGISISDNHILTDLRQALPSVFLRPHAQHGLVIRKRVSRETNVDDYDMASDVVGILKLRIDKVSRWLGDGQMLTQNNLFPPAGYDCGYDILLSRNDIFSLSKYQIARYF
jgi:hypothetical protein